MRAHTLRHVQPTTQTCQKLALHKQWTFFGERQKPDAFCMAPLPAEVKSEMVCKFLIASTSVCPAYAAFLICLWFRAISASPGALSSSSLTAGL